MDWKTTERSMNKIKYTVRDGTKVLSKHNNFDVTSLADAKDHAAMVGIERPINKESNVLQFRTPIGYVYTSTDMGAAWTKTVGREYDLRR